MNKVLVRMSTSTKTGYELVEVTEAGEEIVKSIDKTYPNEPTTLVLPENSANRKYWNSKKVDANDGQCELTYKESKKLGPKSESSTKTKSVAKNWIDYLNDEDKKIAEALIAKAQKVIEIEKAKAIFEAAQAEYNRLMEESNDGNT